MGRTTEVARMSTGGCFPSPRQRFAIKVERKSAKPPPIGDVKKRRCHPGTTGVFSPCSGGDVDNDDDESFSGELSVDDDGESSSEEVNVDENDSSSALGSVSPHRSSPQLASQESHVTEPRAENLSLLSLAAEHMQLRGGCPAGSTVQATVEGASLSPSHEVIDDSSLQGDEGENNVECVSRDENSNDAAQVHVEETHEILVNAVPASVHVDNEGRAATHIGVERSRRATSSLNLTGMADLIDDKDISEVDSIGCDDRVSVNEYRVKPQNAKLLKAIFSRYGDIGANCALGSVAVRSFFMDLVCETLQELMTIDLSKITKNKIQSSKASLDDMKKEKIEVEWLKTRLDEILEAKEAMVHLKPSSDFRQVRAERETKIQTLREHLTVYGRDLSIKMNEIHILQQKIDAALQDLSQEEDEARKIDLTISDCKAKLGHLVRLETLASGLL